ncbi:MAG: heme-binding protein [Methylococcales bacterium]
MNKIQQFTRLAGAVGLLMASNVMADCRLIPGHADLTTALKAAVLPSGGPSNGGFDLNMWLATVDRDGFVCNITFTGDDRGDQWPGSRAIAAQKANTANAFSLPGLALSTANLFTAVQPGNSLFGLQESNPVNAAVAYGNHSNRDRRADVVRYGTRTDPMKARLIGGVNVFGGGLALYDDSGIIGALGVSGDSSCADHNVAWRAREALGLGTTAAAYPGGVASTGTDGIIYDQTNGFAHTLCSDSDSGEDEVADSIGASDGTTAAPVAP